MNYTTIFLGLALLFFMFMGGNFRYIFDWSTGELQGINTFAVVVSLIAFYLIYKGIKQKYETPSSTPRN